jgi:hypothetical protein
LNTQGPGSFDETFEPVGSKRLAARFEFHYTPKQGRSEGGVHRVGEEGRGTPILPGMIRSRTLFSQPDSY